MSGRDDGDEEHSTPKTDTEDCGDGWYTEDGVVMFEFGSVQSSPERLPEYHAKQYYEVRGLTSFLAANCAVPFERSLEVGCGYGRLTPWVGDHADGHHAVDPNRTALAAAKTHYPHVSFALARAQDLPYPSGTFDLVFTWNVLIHVPPDTIEAAATEIDRVLRPDGSLVVMENTTDYESAKTWGRPATRYEALFDMTVTAREPRPVEATYAFEKQGEFTAADNHLMLLE